ncbi:G-type lectin S-receptor-like serine/threonine-protein kinase SD2-5 [Rutidosis leptorrhynchoides]|uniref:G-type lectin S-receptor-like serine/threonine-protein kinase SD2-5 n=1 Tax=Rutidosis leptorrhynchoides TaxID=125765 RepID=UPI003A99D137
MCAPWMISCYNFALIIILNILILKYYSVTAQPFDYPIANLSTTWTNIETAPHSVNFSDLSTVRVILLRGTFGPRFACGFYCNGDCTAYLFAVFIVQTNSGGSIVQPAIGFPQVVWSANRNNPVSYGATLNFTSTGDLVLRDVDGSTVWSTNTAGKSVAGMNLTDDGNLVLFDVNRSFVWQSFDYPTDSLVPEQRLFQGQQLVPSVSSTNWTAQKGLYSLKVITKTGLFGYIESNPPQVYYNYVVPDSITIIEKSYVRLLNGSLSLFINFAEPSNPDNVITIPPASSAQYMKLMPDGHLRVFEWHGAWLEIADLFSQSLEECSYPLACGRNGLCAINKQCSCPVSTSSPKIDYFRAVNDRQPNLGCYEITPLTCDATQERVFIELENVSYFTFIADMLNVNTETCKQACLNDCSCKAAMFQYVLNSSEGDCYLPNDLFTMQNADPNVIHYNALAFVKVQNVRPSTSKIRKGKIQVRTIVISIVGSLSFLVVIVGIIVARIRKRRRNAKMEEEYIEMVPGMPTRFSYAELKTATENFSKKLGQGGFGSVFEGTLEDGSKIAVKCLEGVGQVNKSFLAEVESIGSIHHVNLVRLRGFCACKSERFLVYEFMSNGSLDRWIYYEDREHVLEWDCRKKIILDVAKGLAYLHEDCRQKIIHLDIKPQNILLDQDFNAKVSDFGLSKLIDRNETEVMTTMRGTPGYLAPEWLSSVITEKVDVYSFGIVLLEILCGRKNFDRSQPEESWHLLGVFKKCWEQETLLEIVDGQSEDMKVHSTEVTEMMKVASWCLQTDFTKRPSMSMVVKVLEGMLKDESNLDYNFTDPRVQRTTVEDEKDEIQLFPSLISGPR